MLSVRRRGKPCNRVHQPLEGSSSVFSKSRIEGKSCREGKFFSLPLCCFQVTGVNMELAQPMRRTEVWLNHWISPHRSPTPHWFPVLARALPTLRVTTRHTDLQQFWGSTNLDLSAFAGDLVSPVAASMS